MQLNENLVEALNDLIRINHDRVAGYKNAIEQTDDADLKALFHRMADESETYIDQLSKVLTENGELAEQGSTIYGRFYRTWVNVKVTFSGHDRSSVLAACEYAEDAAQRRYNDMLRSSIAMPYAVRELIANQKIALKASHDTVRTYRNLEQVHH
jgi:uncharacterized protein (TIGR02284 family)